MTGFILEAISEISRSVRRVSCQSFIRGNTKWLCLIQSNPPVSSCSLYQTGQCHPFTPAPLQCLHHYYEWLRPCAPHRYSISCGSSAWKAPLTSERQVSRFHSEACIMFTPFLCRPPPGHSSGYLRAYPGVLEAPRFWWQHTVFRHLINGSLSFISWILTWSCPAEPFP